MATLEDRISKLEAYVKNQRSWKKQFEEEHRIKKEFEKTLGEYSDELKKVREKTRQLKITKSQLEADKERMTKQLAQSDEMIEKLAVLEKDAEAVEQVKLGLRMLLPNQPSSPSPQAEIDMTAVDNRINQRISQLKEIEVVKVDVDQKLKQIVKNKIVQTIIAKVKTLPQPARKAASWLQQRKTASVGELNEFLYDKPGRPSGAFYTNVVNPLEEAHLITKDHGQLRWSLKKNLKSRLGDGVSSEELENLRKYVLTFLLGETS